MNISYREAFLGKKQMKDYKPSSAWVLASDGSGVWSDKFRDLTGLNPNGTIWTTFIALRDDKVDKGLALCEGTGFNGSTKVPYWYYKFEDGKDIIYKVYVDFFKTNQKEIQDAIVDNYNGPEWIKTLSEGRTIKIPI